MRVWLILIAIALLAVFTMPAQADRLEDIQARVTELAQQRVLISNEILRLEGAYRERQVVMAEEAAALVQKDTEEATLLEKGSEVEPKTKE